MNGGDMIRRVRTFEKKPEGKHDRQRERERERERDLYSVSVGRRGLRALCPQHLKALSTGVQSAT